MPPKRGQPPKPPEEQRVETAMLRYSKKEMQILQQAWEIAGSPNTLSRWLASITLEEAKRIVTDSSKK